MAIELEEFHHDLFQKMHGNADADGKYLEDAFFDIFCASLVEAGELDSADRAHYLAPRGMRIDGFGGDPLASGGVLSLIVLDFSQTLEIAVLTKTEMTAVFRRASNFMEKTLDPSFRNALEETSPAFGLADLIAERWHSLSKVKLFLITNRVLSSRVDGLDAGEIDGIPLVYSVWDLARLHRFETSGHGREEIEIDLFKDYGGPIPALPAHLDNAQYEAYLAVVPGVQLAAIYDRWGARLLEQNVRVFLQARGNVNKGIRNTIENDPEMFFAYNNGITATAESVESETCKGGVLLTGFRNFQIVNGGQTTASIHAASRKKDIDLSNVFVQMKLSIIVPERTVDIVPKISEYANSQNRVNAADFFANHPFHVRLEEFSRRLYAPSPDGSFRESKWFYERARGQYNDARGYLSDAARKKFGLEYPKHQVFTKTDLAKYMNVWWGHPDIVSKGAQKNFAHFAHRIGGDWSKNPDKFNELFYREVIAKAIAFREVEKLVTGQHWYQGGYRANIVAYAISKLAFDYSEKGIFLNFETIWRNQCVPDWLKEALCLATRSVHDILLDTPSGMRNVTEWAKQQACWNRVQGLHLAWPRNLFANALSEEEKKGLEAGAVKEQKEFNGIQAQTIVFQAGARFWREVLAWGENKKLLTDKETSVIAVASQIPSKLPSDKQSVLILETLKRLQKEGCPLEIP